MSVKQKPILTKALTFNECHIIIENIFRYKEKSKFIGRLHTLIANTEDESLLRDLQNLEVKVKTMSSSEYQKMREDADEGKLLFPPFYRP